MSTHHTRTHTHLPFAVVKFQHTRHTQSPTNTHTHTHTFLHVCVLILLPAQILSDVTCMHACWVVLLQVPVDKIVEKEKIVEVKVPMVTKVFQVLVP